MRNIKKHTPPHELTGIYSSSPLLESKNIMHTRTSNSLWVRIPMLFIGMFIMAFGIGSITYAGIGTTAIGTLPFTVSVIYGITFGRATFLINSLFVLGQILLLRRQFKPINILQLPIVFIFANFIDLSMAWLSHVPLRYYFRQFALSLLGNVFIALGIVIQIHSKTLVQPGEGIVMAVAMTFKKSFGNMKIANDISLVILAALLGWFMLGEIVAIREGTLISAVLIGLLVKAIRYLLQKYKKGKTV